jgi:hypothetical protein
MEETIPVIGGLHLEIGIVCIEGGCIDGQSPIKEIEFEAGFPGLDRFRADRALIYEIGRDLDIIGSALIAARLGQIGLHIAA